MVVVQFELPMGLRLADRLEFRSQSLQHVKMLLASGVLKEGSRTADNGRTECRATIRTVETLRLPDFHAPPVPSIETDTRQTRRRAMLGTR